MMEALRRHERQPGPELELGADGVGEQCGRRVREGARVAVPADDVVDAEVCAGIGQ